MSPVFGTWMTIKAAHVRDLMRSVTVTADERCFYERSLDWLAIIWLPLVACESSP